MRWRCLIRIRLTTAQRVREDVKAVGIRAHYFNAKSAQNRAVEYLREMEEPFEWIVEFRWRTQKPGTAPLWWRVPMTDAPPAFRKPLALRPPTCWLLYQ